MKKLKLILIFILFSPFYVSAFSDVKILDEMNDCLTREFNKCLNEKQTCQNSCGWGNTDCIEGCYVKMEKCVDYSRKIEDKYDECYNEYESFIFGKNKVANAKDFCDGKKMFADCMDSFNGLCKVSWSRDCDNVKDSKDQSRNLGDKNNQEDKLIGMPIISGGAVDPCIGETPKNSEACQGDDKEIYYYAKKKLTDVCSMPQGSEPKCEYICQNGYDFVDGECENSGIFTRIMKWLKNLF